MVYYSVDTPIRNVIYFAIAVISIFVTYLISFLNNHGLAMIIAPSALMTFGVILFIFNTYIWKIEYLKKIVKIPNLNGKWVGYLTRFNENTTLHEKIPITITIVQSWLKIDIMFESEQTLSHAKTVGFHIENSELIEISYIYSVHPKTYSSQSTLPGIGATELKLNAEDKNAIIEGIYFSDKCRKGTIKAQL